MSSLKHSSQGKCPHPQHGFCNVTCVQVLAALGLTVKRSLAELSRAVNGDAKTEVLPLFYVSLELERAIGTSDTVELRPTLQDLANMIRSACRELLQVCIP